MSRVRELTRMTMMSSAPSQSSQSNNSSELLKGFSSLSSRLTDRFKEAGLGSNIEGLISGVKNFLPANKDLTITKITESLMDPQNASSSAIANTENYLYYDPRSANARGNMPSASQTRNSNQYQQQSGISIPGSLGVGGSVSSMSRSGIDASFGQRRQGFSEAIVFTVGGGSMDEYGNLQAWVNRTNGVASGTTTSLGPGGYGGKRVVYGSTELLNAEDFIRCELARLGKESG